MEKPQMTDRFLPLVSARTQLVPKDVRHFQGVHV
jgi:hypothetical protein